MQLKSRFPSSLSSVVQVEHIYVVKYYGTYTGVALCAFPRRGRTKQHLRNDYGEMCYPLDRIKKIPQ